MENIIQGAPSSSSFCPHCGQAIAETDMFCSHCGTQIIRQDLPISMGRKFYIYAVSVLLPPLGFIWLVKYIKSTNPDLKKVGILAGVLTLISSIITIWVTLGLLQSIQNSFSLYNNSSLGL